MGRNPDVYALGQHIKDSQTREAVQQIERLLRGVLDRVTDVEDNGGGGIPAGVVQSVTSNSPELTVNPTTGDVELEIDLSDLSPVGHTHPQSDVTNLVSDLAAKVPATRTIATTAPLQGGGDLSANRTLSIDTFTDTVKGAVPPPNNGGLGYFLQDDGTWAEPVAGAPALILGTGYDGPLNFDGVSTVLGLVPVGGVYTLTRAINPTNMTVPVGVTVKQNGFPIVGTGQLTLNGVISNNGTSNTGARAGAAGAPAGDLPGGANGSDGSLANNIPGSGTNTSTNAPAWMSSTAVAGGGGVAGTAGGSGGTGHGGGGGARRSGPGVAAMDGAVGGPVTLSATQGSALLPIYGLLSAMSVQTTPSRYSVGSGGGGGASASDGAVSVDGAGGGGGGGWVVVMFQSITGSGSIQATGGNGGPGASQATAFSCGGGGGGGGGGGVIVVGKFTGSFPSTSVAGGTGGIAGTGIQANGTAGGAGGAGRVFQLNLGSGGSGGGSSGLPDGDYGDITVSGGTTTLTVDPLAITSGKLAASAVTTAKIADDNVTMAKIEDAPGARLIGALSATSPSYLTGTQATTLLDAFTSGLKGLAPASGGGTANFLRADGTWAVPPGSGGGTPTFSGASVYNSANQSIATSTSTVVTYNTEDYDTDGYHSTVSNTGRLVAPATGYYKVIAHVGWAANGTGVREASIFKNGTTNVGPSVMQPNSANSVFQTAVADVQLNAGEYVEVQAWQNSGGNLNVLGATYVKFQIQRIG